MFENKLSRAAVCAGVLALLWFGLVFGVSLLATPVKFLAPSLDLAVALDVGRHTFSVLNIVELLLLTLLALAILIAARTRPLVAGLMGLLVILAIQSFWLLPALDARVDIYMAGQVPPPSPLHTLYAASEGVKLLVLALIAAFSLRGALRAER